VHGTDDTVVDYKYSEEIKAKFPNVKLITSEGQSHKGIIFDELLRNELNSILQLN
jgi:alpha-beta hydrolase superfamily lysophospholipase